MGKDYRDIKYKVFSARLSDEIKQELENRRKDFKSWNLLFRELLKMEVKKNK